MAALWMGSATSPWTRFDNRPQILLVSPVKRCWMPHLGKAPIPVPCSAPSSHSSYFFSSTSLFLSTLLLPSFPSPPSLGPPPCSSAQARAACTAGDEAFSQQHLLHPPSTFSHPGAISANPNLHPFILVVEGSPPLGQPRRCPYTSGEMLRWFLGAEVPFLSIQRRFPSTQTY